VEISVRSYSNFVKESTSLGIKEKKDPGVRFPEAETIRELVKKRSSQHQRLKIFRVMRSLVQSSASHFSFSGRKTGRATG
jgi:tRNA A37 threonylcarbamoyltransferase TsaD